MKEWVMRDKKKRVVKKRGGEEKRERERKWEKERDINRQIGRGRETINSERMSKERWEREIE